MVLVGRQRETACIARELSAGRNVILTGKYGVGRTTLVMQVASAMGKEWRFLFADFSRGPAEVCSDLLVALEPRSGRPSRMHRISFVSARHRVLTARRGEGRHEVVVLDNLPAATPPKVRFVRRLVDSGRFQVVVVADGQAGRADLPRLREALYPVLTLEVTKLPLPAAREYFQIVAAQRGLPWGEAEISWLAKATGGYPLAMADAVTRALARVAGGRRTGDQAADQPLCSVEEEAKMRS